MMPYCMDLTQQMDGCCTDLDVEVSHASLDLEISHVPSCFDLVSPLFALLCVRRVELLLTNRSVDLFLCAFASPPSWWVF